MRDVSDVIVIGAGLAGSAATLRLAKAGHNITVLEARARAGGRGYLKPYAGDDDTAPLEFGGAWITPWHTRLRTLVAEHGLQLRPRHPVTRRFWMRDGALHDDGAASNADRMEHERVLARVAADSILLKKGFGENERGEALRGISFTQYLDRLQAPRGTRDLFSAWWSVSGNGDHDVVAASEFLASCAYDNGLAEGMIKYWTDTVVPGMGALAAAMISASGARLVTEAPVSRIASDDAGVAVHAGDNLFMARAVIVALGVNQLAGVAFDPPLPAAKRAAIERGHGGRAFKLWARMRGVPVGTLVTGDGRGIEFAFAERLAANGDTLVVCFGLAGNGSQPGDSGWVRSEMAQLFPNAQFMGHDWHDWVDDPFARGTWVAAPAGHEAGLECDNWQPEGRIAFASSDYARDQAGWFEGAVVSGEDAAEAAIKLI